MDSYLFWDLIRWIHYAALSLWLGGIFFLSFGTAPAAHRSMASRPIAGQMVSLALKKLNRIELAACGILLITSAAASQMMFKPQYWIYLFLMTLTMGLTTLTYALYISPRLEKIKEETPQFEILTEETEPRKIFRKWHQLYVRLMTFNLVLGFLLLYASVLWMV